MRTVRDLRELVNVSRLSFKESDDEKEDDENGSSASAYYSMAHSSTKLSNSFRFDPAKDFKIVTAKPSRPPLINLSKTTPIIKSVNTVNNNNNNNLIANSKMSASRDLLLDRNSIPSVSFSLSKSKKPLPPLSSRSNTSIAKSTASDNDQEEESKETSSAHVSSINIEPLQMQLLIKPDDVKQKQDSGNFDDMLTYIDASVVSEWLNRANRSLRKMHKWHQDNSGLFNEPSSNRTKQSQYEPFILFASFWLGSHPTARFDHKQRRQLIEMEHSIICDEVQQAFQVGIESQQIGIADTHRLLRAVLKEYPLQFLSFRGVYLLLDYIEILSSNRQDDYKKLLSDVKCRTLNKQYAQWLLSIRSFALINLCWSIVKFYRRTLEKEVNCFKTTSSTSQLEELDGRLSSLSISNKETVVSKPNVNSSCSSLSNSSTSSSTSSLSSSLLKKRLKNSSLKKENEQDFLPILNQVKYDLYVENAYKLVFFIWY
jgi:hypothetical protein